MKEKEGRFREEEEEESVMLGGVFEGRMCDSEISV